jgi:nucleoside-diphosphate kinase|tara:strand:- start:1460 stop:1888 length:429 start_codon:yes stop_codon:yes gene_type:complete
MPIQRTLSIIKPDATKRNITGKIIQKFEDGGLSIIAQKRILLTQGQAEGFYSVHKERPFYNNLVSFMTSGPVVVQILEGDNAIQRNRDIMGATNPEEANEGTIRAEYALNIEANSVHGSDSEDNAAKEISFFFDSSEINSQD